MNKEKVKNKILDLQSVISVEFIEESEFYKPDELKDVIVIKVDIDNVEEWLEVEKTARHIVRTYEAPDEIYFTRVKRKSTDKDEKRKGVD